MAKPLKATRVARPRNQVGLPNIHAQIGHPVQFGQIFSPFGEIFSGKNLVGERRRQGIAAMLQTLNLHVDIVIL